MDTIDFFSWLSLCLGHVIPHYLSGSYNTITIASFIIFCWLCRSGLLFTGKLGSCCINPNSSDELWRTEERNWNPKFDLVPVNSKSYLHPCLSTLIQWGSLFSASTLYCFFQTSQQRVGSPDNGRTSSLCPLPLTLGLSTCVSNTPLFDHTKGPLLRLLTLEVYLEKGILHVMLELFFHILLQLSCW